MVALVGVGEGGGEGDLLATVGGVEAERVVVNADAGVGVVGGEADLHGEGEGVGDGGREVEGEEGGVLEREAWFGWAEDDPYEEDKEEDKEDEGGDADENEAEETAARRVVVAAVLGGHGGCWRITWRNNGLEGDVCENMSE